MDDSKQKELEALITEIFGKFSLQEMKAMRSSLERIIAMTLIIETGFGIESVIRVQSKVTGLLRELNNKDISLERYNRLTDPMLLLTTEEFQYFKLSLGLSVFNLPVAILEA